jgi:hypothetical protein
MINEKRILVILITTDDLLCASPLSAKDDDLRLIFIKSPRHRLNHDALPV